MVKKKTKKIRITEDPSVQYYKLLKGNVRLIFVCYGGEIQGLIGKESMYELKLVGRGQPLNKTEVLYFYAVEYDEAVKQLLEVDSEVVKQNFEAQYRAKERKDIKDSWIKKYSKEGKPMKVTMRNGHVFSGTILSFGIFSFLLQLSGPQQLMILRHSVHELDYA